MTKRLLSQAPPNECMRRLPAIRITPKYARAMWDLATERPCYRDQAIKLLPMGAADRGGMRARLIDLAMVYLILAQHLDDRGAQ
jgi:hypothetical protein